jgi:hypothetical protein
MASCGDARALRAIAPPPPAIAAQVGALRRELASAKALRDGGKLGDALVVLRRVAAESRSTGYGPLESVALLQLGDVELASGDAREADVTLARVMTSHARVLSRGSCMPWGTFSSSSNAWPASMRRRPR